MSSTPIDHFSSLRIGTVEYVAPDELHVILDSESPESIALNTGNPRLFPRINGYLLVPIDLGFMVGQISWITIKRTQNFSNVDNTLVNLPMPYRELQLHPIGELTNGADGNYKFRRGLETFPSVGDIVVIPTDAQLKSILESGEKRRVYIGTSPLIGNAKVMVDPDKMFGRHLAVLGNTGSGKSCSVAGLVRWSVEEAQKLSSDNKTNSRFIILDPNGEYAKAFEDMNSAKVFQVQIGKNNIKNKLKVPLWLWNSAEWCGFTKASDKTQRPTIIRALKAVKSCLAVDLQSKEHELSTFIGILMVQLDMMYDAGEPFGSFPKPKNFLETLSKWTEGINTDKGFSDDLNSAIDSFKELIQNFSDERSGNFANFAFTRQEIDNLRKSMQEIFNLSGGKIEDLLPIDADSPKNFSGDEFIKAIKASAELLKTTDYVETLLTRVKLLLSNTIIKSVVADSTISLESWLNTYIGKNNEETISIIDLSLLPSEVTSIITAVIARMVFEALQRYRKTTMQILPTVFVMEEAHYFVKRYNDDDSQSSGKICCKIFEKIAREGRKFGLGLVLSSQRPSELSPTVLSQCNTFLLHRISNERDQELVGKLLPDNMRGIFRELPALPSQEAVLLGWASELPVLVKMRSLPLPQQPQSSDPDYWDVWTKKETREVNWKDIADRWQKNS